MIGWPRHAQVLCLLEAEKQESRIVIMFYGSREAQKHNNNSASQKQKSGEAQHGYTVMYNLNASHNYCGMSAVIVLGNKQPGTTKDRL